MPGITALNFDDVLPRPTAPAALALPYPSDRRAASPRHRLGVLPPLVEEEEEEVKVEELDSQTERFTALAGQAS